MTAWAILLAIVLGSSATAFEPYASSTCPALFRSMIGPSLTDADVDRIVSGDGQTSQVAEMGEHALSFLAGAEHLSGLEKAELWPRMAVRIARLSGRRFTSVPRSVDAAHLAVFQGHRGELLVIDLQDGQLYRGWYGDAVPADFDFAEALRTQRLRKLGGPSK